MAILLAYIDAEPNLRCKRNALSIPAAAAAQKSYAKIRNSRKIATTPHEAATDEPPTVLPPVHLVHEPDIQHQGPVKITQPTGYRVVPLELEGLDSVTAFNTQLNSRRSTSSYTSTSPVAKLKEKKRVTFAKKLDIIPPVCTDLVLYREYRLDSSRLNTETRKMRRILWSAFLVMGLAVMEYFSLVFFGESLGFFGMDFSKVFLI